MLACLAKRLKDSISIPTFVDSCVCVFYMIKIFFGRVQFFEFCVFLLSFLLSDNLRFFGSSSFDHLTLSSLAMLFLHDFFFYYL